jgi:DNA-binding XRE family transcriptional regulator
MKEELKIIKQKLVSAIREQRALRELTQAQMAIKLDITQKAYENIENGKLKIETLYKWLTKITRL